MKSERKGLMNSDSMLYPDVMKQMTLPCREA